VEYKKLNNFFSKEPSKKDVRSQGEGVVQFGHFADKGGSSLFTCGCPHFLLQKALDFSEFVVCPHGQLRGLS